MASTHKITAVRRSDAGKGASRRLRHAGQVPAIVYGNNLEPLNIQLNHEAIILAAKHEWFFSSVLDLDIEGEMQRVLVRDWQVHPYKQQMLHMDFFRIDENEKIHVNVPLHFLNQEDSPAGKTSGVVISHNLTEVEVVCLSKHLPEHLDVDLSELEAGQVLHMSDLKLPEGVELTALNLGEEHDQAVVSAHAMKAEPEPEEVSDDAADEQASAADTDDNAGDDQ